MAKSSKGRNAGVTGLVDFDGSPTFVVRVARFSRQEGAAALVRTQRGDARRRIKQTTPGGTLMLWGTVRKDGYPEPASLKGASGTVVLNLGGDAKQTLAVTVLSSKIDHDNESEDEWQIALVAEVTANPTFAGFGGSQPAAAADPSLDAAPTHEGATKTVDPDGLQDADTVRIDVDGLTDTDAAEATWITDTIAGFTATRLHMKVRSAQFARTDHWGGSLVVSLARTTSAEDVVNQSTWVVSDTNNIADAASVAGINDNGDAPAGLIYRTTKTQELNDDNVLLVDDYGLRSTAQDITMPESGHTIDPLAVESEQKETITYPTGGSVPSAPAVASAELQVVATSTQDVNAVTKKVTYAYAVNDSHQKEEFPRTKRETDASAIEQEHLVADAFTTASPPADPTPPSGMVLASRFDVPFTPTQSVRVYRYAYVTRETAMERARYELVTDPNVLRSTKQTGDVWDTAGSAPSTPSAPSGLKLVDYRDVGIDSHPTKVCRVYRWGRTDSVDDVKYPRTSYEVDPQGLETRVRVADVGGPPTLPVIAGLVERSTTEFPLSDNDSVYVVDGGLRSTKDDVEFPGTWLMTDASGIDDEARRTVVTNAATLAFPGTIAASVGTLYLRDTRPTQLTAAGLYEHQANYGRQTRAMEVINHATRSVAFAERPRRDVTASILTSTNTAAVDAQALADTLVSDSTFDQVEATKLHDGKTLLVLSKQATQWELEIESRTFGSLQTEYQLLVGGSVKVFVEDVYEVADGWWVYRLGTVPVRCTLMELTLYKRYSGDTVYAYPDGAGTVNATAFLGLTARCVTYAGTVGRAAVKDSFRYPGCTAVASVAFERPRRFGYKFLYDSRGIILANDICPGGERWTDTDLSGVSARSWVSASTLGLSATHGLDADFYQTFFNTTP